MTFPGVAIVLDDAEPVTGSEPSNPAHLGYRSLASPVTFTAGDSFMAGFVPTGADYPILNLAEPGDPITAWATFEHTTGSATVRLSWGWDPGYGAGSPALATTAMGQVSLSGAGVTPVAVPGFDFQRFYDSVESLVLFVEVLTGSVTVSQLRMRVWPSGGALGSWVASSGFPVDRTASPLQTVMVPGSGQFVGSTFYSDTAADAHDQASTSLLEDATHAGIDGLWSGAQSERLFTIERVTVAYHSLNTQQAWWRRTSQAEVLFLNVEDAGRDALNTLITAGSPTPLPGAAIRPPDQVNDADELYVDLAGGAIVLEQARLVGTWTSTNGAGELVWSTIPRTLFEAGPVAFPSTPLSMPTGVDLPVDVTIPLAGLTGDGHALLLGARGGIDPYPYDGPPFIGALGAPWIKEATAEYGHDQIDDGLRFTVRVPAFRYWDADAPPVAPPLRQVQRDDAGTGFSGPARWTGASSRQASNRWIGYL